MLRLFGRQSEQREERSFPDSLRNPFETRLITDCSFYNYITWGGEITHYAIIKFKNGSTKGEHRIDGEDFLDVVNKVDTFIKSL